MNQAGVDLYLYSFSHYPAQALTIVGVGKMNYINLILLQVLRLLLQRFPPR